MNNVSSNHSNYINVCFKYQYEPRVHSLHEVLRKAEKNLKKKMNQLSFKPNIIKAVSNLRLKECPKT